MKTTRWFWMLVVLLAPALVVPAASLAQTRHTVNDGWYEATVELKRTAAGQPEFHKLKVLVHGDRVVAIDFGNGETVHDRPNSEGYVYSGGRLSFERDWSAGVISKATTNVTVKTKDGRTLRFKITIG